ncbi:hypothetical protein FQR65_LT20650 [Abscondita terminalis]|nr:hypothetical protein FQR65_LT20650 [Abscondita terminalis]
MARFIMSSSLVPGWRDEDRDNQVLLLARFLAELFEHLLEAVVAADAGLHHLGQRPGLGVARVQSSVAAPTWCAPTPHNSANFNCQSLSARPEPNQKLLERAACAAAAAPSRLHVGRGAAQVGDGAGEKPFTFVCGVSTSWMMDSSERLWMMRPSCSVMEQKVQPPKQPRMMLTEVRIISQGRDFVDAPSLAAVFAASSGADLRA